MLRKAGNPNNLPGTFPSPVMRISFTATGDSFIVRPSDDTTPDFQKIAGVIRQGDVRFTNLETVVRRQEGFPAAQSGGTWASSPPEVLESLKAYGFNCVAWGNNHTLDYSHGGLEATERYLNAAGLVHAGAGSSLEEAGAYRLIETPHGRVALLAVTSTFHPSWTAGAARPRVGGRPGVNPLAYKTLYRVHPEKLKHLEAIAAASRINTKENLRLKEGFRPPDPEGVFRFGYHLFTAAGPEGEGEFTTPSPQDAKRIQASIRAAREEADLVVLSVHSHEGKNADKSLPADFLVEFSRSCIDAGAHAVIGHGPHVLRGIEIYQGRPIFYSLGNFIFQNELVGHLPSDFYKNYGIPAELSTQEALAVRSQNGTRGLAVNPGVWRSVIATWEMTAGNLTRLELIPVDLGQHLPVEKRGTPTLTSDVTALEEILRLSAPFGTRMEIQNGRAVAKFEA